MRAAASFSGGVEKGTPISMFDAGDGQDAKKPNIRRQRELDKTSPVQGRRRTDITFANAQQLTHIETHNNR